MWKRMLGVAALLAASILPLSVASAGQIRYYGEGTGAGIFTPVSGPSTPFANLSFTFDVVGDTSNYFDDLANEVRFIPLFEPAVTLSGAFGTSSVTLAPPGPGSQRILAVGLGSNSGKMAFGEFTGGFVELGDLITGAGLNGYTGLTSLAPTPISMDEVEFDFANGASLLFNSLTNLSFSATLLGQSAANPLVPVPTGSGSGFSFTFDATGGVTVFIDPPVAIGYDYVLGPGSPLIAQAIFPVIGSSVYEVYALSDLSTPLFSGVSGGSSVDFTSLAAYANGIAGFALRGIDAAAGLDPSDPMAFVTGLVFVDDGPVSLQQIPVTNSVPEPATWAMLVAGFGLLGGALRRRARLVAA